MPHDPRCHSVLDLIAVTLPAGFLSLALTACAAVPPPAPSNVARTPGTVELNQSPPNDVPLGGGGTGTVFFNNTLYHFAISGLGVDGSAVAIIQTSGEVYQLVDIGRFSGTYRRAPGSVVPGQPLGGLWLQNERATVLHLKAPPQGRLPDLGDDALRVVLDQ